MVKILCFLKRRADFSREQFKEYYESNHVPLVGKLLPFYEEYRRNYLVDAQDYETGHFENKGDTGLFFDVVTELTFETQEKYQELVDALADPKIGDAIAADEEKFMDRAAMSVVVDERRTA